jgi:hypothetical protein
MDMSVPKSCNGVDQWVPADADSVPAAAVRKQNVPVPLLPSGPETKRLRFAGPAPVAALYALMLLAFCRIR